MDEIINQQIQFHESLSKIYLLIWVKAQDKASK